MNCGLAGDLDPYGIVLIDTWWNVNYKKQCSTHYNDGVLIDTWWNVNSEKMKESARAGSFNRYMVECEYVIKQGIIIFIVVLIDTWWNVNKIKELVITQIKRF